MTGWQKCSNRRGAVSVIRLAGWLKHCNLSLSQQWLPNPQRKRVQALLQRLCVDVLQQRKGMCMPEGQSRHCPTCCIGHRLSLWVLFWLHSQELFWSLIDNHCLLQGICTWHLIQALYRWSLLKLIEIHTNFFVRIARHNVLEHLLWLGLCRLCLQTLGLSVAQNSIERLVSFKFAILRIHLLFWSAEEEEDYC